MEPTDAALSPETASQLFRALSDPRRLAIVFDLAARSAPARVTDLTACCDIDFSGVSRHLKALREAGLVRAEKRGRETLYTLRADAFADSLDAFAQSIRDSAGNA